MQIRNLMIYYDSYDGGYDLRAAQMKGGYAGSLSAFMLAPSAALAGTMLYKHNYTFGTKDSSSVNSFTIRADNKSSSGNNLSVKAAALMEF